MNVLIIGKTGQLARALRLFAPGLSYLGRDALDLAEPGAAEDAVTRHAPDLVINAAAYTAVDRAEAEPALADAVNHLGVAGLARGAARAGAALLHVSTDYVFDGTKTAEWSETDPVAPLGHYGASKLAGERAALALHARTLILRTSWVYSPWGRNFVTTMLGLADRSTLRVVADQHGKPTSALDLAEVILAIAPRLVVRPDGQPVHGIFHYAGRGITSWEGFAREIFSQATGRLIRSAPLVEPISNTAYAGPARRPLNSALDCTAFERVFGIDAIEWRTALARVIDCIATERGMA